MRKGVLWPFKNIEWQTDRSRDLRNTALAPKGMVADVPREMVAILRHEVVGSGLLQ